MKLGFGLYRHQLDRDHFRFARQCGATHVVVHLVDYFKQGGATNAQRSADGHENRRLGRGGRSRQFVGRRFSVRHKARTRRGWPRVGRAGVPVIGYNFSLAGVSSRTKSESARGGAVALGLDGPNDTPVPAGMVWNMVY